MAWPLATQTVRLLFLRTLEAAATSGASTAGRATEHSPTVLPLILADPQCRLCIFGGRSGLTRSLASAYACFVTLFLGGSRGAEQRRFQLPDRRNIIFGRLAVSRDGAAVFTVYCDRTLRKFCVRDGSQLHATPTGVSAYAFCVAVSRDTGDVLLANHHTVEVFTPQLDHVATINTRYLDSPFGVCGDEDLIVVVDLESYDDRTDTMCGSRVHVFRSADGKPVASFGDDHLEYPCAVCFMSCHRRVAVADDGFVKRVCVYTTAGVFLRHVGAGVLARPTDVACSAFDELVVADKGLRCVVLFTASGDVAQRIGSDEPFVSVALHGDVLYAYKSNPFDLSERDNAHVVVFQ